MAVFIQHKALNSCKYEKTDEQDENDAKPEPYAALGSPSITGSGQVEEECSERSDDAKRHLFSDAETNTVSSSGLSKFLEQHWLFHFCFFSPNLANFCSPYTCISAAHANPIFLLTIYLYFSRPCKPYISVPLVIKLFSLSQIFLSFILAPLVLYFGFMSLLFLHYQLLFLLPQLYISAPSALFFCSLSSIFLLPLPPFLCSSHAPDQT